MAEQQTILTTSVLDFLKVSTEFCRYLESDDMGMAADEAADGQTDSRGYADGHSYDETDEDNARRHAFCRVMLTLLPMVYLKTQLLPYPSEAPAGFNEPAVTEDDYNFIRQRVCTMMGDRDDFLDTFVEDFKYSEAPILCTVSECLADIYQCLRDMVEVCRHGHDEAMEVAIYEAQTEFRLSWGQKLLNALRAIHDAQYGA